MPTIARDAPSGATNALLQLRVVSIGKVGGDFVTVHGLERVEASGGASLNGVERWDKTRLISISRDGFKMLLIMKDGSPPAEVVRRYVIVFPYNQTIITNIPGYTIMGSFKSNVVVTPKS